MVIQTLALNKEILSESTETMAISLSESAVNSVDNFFSSAGQLRQQVTTAGSAQ
jgi:hypothetical protein